MHILTFIANFLTFMVYATFHIIIIWGVKAMHFKRTNFAFIDRVEESWVLNNRETEYAKYDYDFTDDITIELDKIIEEEKLNKDETYKFVDNAFRDGFVPTTGVTVNKILPPVSLFTKTNDRGTKRATVLEKIINFFNMFKDII